MQVSEQKEDVADIVLTETDSEGKNANEDGYTNSEASTNDDTTNTNTNTVNEDGAKGTTSTAANVNAAANVSDQAQVSSPTLIHITANANLDDDNTAANADASNINNAAQGINPNATNINIAANDSVDDSFVLELNVDHVTSNTTNTFPVLTDLNISPRGVGDCSL